MRAKHLSAIFGFQLNDVLSQDGKSARGALAVLVLLACDGSLGGVPSMDQTLWSVNSRQTQPCQREGQMLLRSCQNDTAASLKVAANRGSGHGFEAERDVTWMLCDAQQLLFFFFFAGCSLWSTSVA